MPEAATASCILDGVRCNRVSLLRMHSLLFKVWQRQSRLHCMVVDFLLGLVRYRCRRRGGLMYRKRVGSVAGVCITHDFFSSPGLRVSLVCGTELSTAGQRGEFQRWRPKAALSSVTLACLLHAHACGHDQSLIGHGYMSWARRRSFSRSTTGVARKTASWREHRILLGSFNLRMSAPTLRREIMLLRELGTTQT